jgi:thymidylate synthase
MIYTSGKRFHSVYLDILTYILQNGELVGKAKTVNNLGFTITDPKEVLLNHPKNWGWCFLEGINRMSWGDPDLMNPGTAYKFRSSWKRKLEREGGKFCYDYGHHFANQITDILKKLRSKSQREAIMTVWDRRHLVESKDYERRPCTLTLHFYWWQGKINLNVNMRTSDVMNLLPYDVFHHTLLQRYVATKLGAEMGEFYFFSSIAYYQKKRDITGSVENTFKALLNADYLPYEENDWFFGDAELNYLVDLTKALDSNPTQALYLPQNGISKYAQNYAKALLYLYGQNNQDFTGSEFEIILKQRN